MGTQAWAKRSSPDIPRIVGLRVQNYRALRDFEMGDLTRLAVLIGANGSGKSTVFDVFAFLSECFSIGLRKAWDRRGRFKELRSRDSQGPIVIEVKYKEKARSPLTTYHLAIDEGEKGPYVAEEWLQWTRGRHGRPFRFLEYGSGRGRVVSGDQPDEQDERVEVALESAEFLAVSTLGQLADNPRVSALRRFITGWHLSYFTVGDARGSPEAGPQERLSPTGDNLPNVIQYLKEQHPDRLGNILDVLKRRVPQLQTVTADIMADGRLLLQLMDAPFTRPILARFSSDGTLKMLAYLTLFGDPTPPPFVGIEEPENHLHPRLLPELAEGCKEASTRMQILITTHSPHFINGLDAEQAWVLYRGSNGYTRARCAAQMKGVKDFLQEGAKLGQLWMEGHFDVGDPLRRPSPEGSRER
jgi:predicted ATPase